MPFHEHQIAQKSRRMESVTLVAAIKIQSIPTILADMLFTDDSTEALAIFMPTIPNRALTPLNNRTIVSVRSKIIILNGSLAVAFTGYISAGKMLFTDLERRFSRATPSEKEIEDALCSWNIALNGRASVVGWVANPSPRCFEWSAKPGARVAWVTHAFRGSGASHFQNIILQADRSGWGDLTDRELSTFIAVTKANKVLSDEMLSQGGLSNHYGYCLEIVQWTGEVFEFQRKLASVFLDVVVKSEGPLHFNPVSYRIYERHKRFALIETVHCYSHKGPDGVDGRHAFVEMISGMHDDCVELPFDRKLLDPNAPIYTFNIAFRSEETGKSGVMQMTVASGEVEISGSSENFQVILREPATTIASLKKAVI